MLTLMCWIIENGDIFPSGGVALFTVGPATTRDTWQRRSGRNGAKETRGKRNTLVTQTELSSLMLKGKSVLTSVRRNVDVCRLLAKEQIKTTTTNVKDTGLSINLHYTIYLSRFSFIFRSTTLVINLLLNILIFSLQCCQLISGCDRLKFI